MQIDGDQNLFSVGHPFSGHGGLTAILEQHERKTLHQISLLSDINKLTDDFVEALIKESLVKPVVLHADQIEHTKETVLHGYTTTGRQATTALTVCVPFSGDPAIFYFCPGESTLNFPFGRVYEKEKEVRFILMPERDDVPKEIKENLDKMNWNLVRANKRVEEFNLALPAKVKKAFTSKYDKLLKEAEMLESIGIPEKKKSKEPQSMPAVEKPKRKTTQQVGVHITNVYTKEFTQLNYNDRDVNNAIQSS